jgi:hypothetical protein
MKFFKRHWGKILLLLFLLWLYGPTDELEGYLDRDRIVKKTLHYAKFAPFPADYFHLLIAQHSSWFHTWVTGSFTATPAQVDDWLKNSPGIQGRSSMTLRDGSICLEGYRDGQVVVSPDRTRVSFRIPFD